MKHKKRITHGNDDMTGQKTRIWRGVVLMVVVIVLGQVLFHQGLPVCQAEPVLEFGFTDDEKRVWKEPVTGMEFVWVPKGCYQMGCGSWTSDCRDHEKPVHKVCLDGFWIGRYEVTQGQWKKIMGSNPSRFKSGDQFPVESVYWEDVKQFISRLNQHSGQLFSLPTEAQWEYAARSGGKNEKYAGGSNVGSVAWYSENSGKKTHRVGTKAPNGLGIYDMSGNVWEWCEDVFDSNAYSKHSLNNPVITSDGFSRVGRGGGWDGGPGGVRVSSRYWLTLGYRSRHLGFRLSLPQVRQE